MKARQPLKNKENLKNKYMVDNLKKENNLKSDTCNIEGSIYHISPEKIVENSSPWQPQHNWPQTENAMSCLKLK